MPPPGGIVVFAKGFPQLLWKRAGKACGQAVLAAFASGTCYALGRKCATVLPARRRLSAQFSTVIVCVFCTSLWTTQAASFVDNHLAHDVDILPSRDLSSRTSPQPLWSIAGKACGQVAYLPERKGTADGLRKDWPGDGLMPVAAATIATRLRGCRRSRWRRVHRSDNAGPG